MEYIKDNLILKKSYAYYFQKIQNITHIHKSCWENKLYEEIDSASHGMQKNECENKEETLLIITIILLLLLLFFFSGSDAALSTLSKMRLQSKIINGKNKDETLFDLVTKSNELSATIMVGYNIVIVALVTIVTAFAIDNNFHSAVAAAITSAIIIIFFEPLSRSIVVAFSESFLNIVTPMIRFFSIILKPITFIFHTITNMITKILSKGEVSSVSLSKEDFRAIVEIADSEGMFQKDESLRIKGILDFQNLNVKDVLKTPRVDLVGIPSTAIYEEVRDIVIENTFTRYPVYGEDIDDIVGVFHSKYLIKWSTEPKKSLLDFCDTDPLIVYEFHSVESVFRRMTKEKKHLAIVLDEYGGTEGIITHEDIIESMIGLEIEDEMDLDEDAMIEKLTETEIVCDGKITLYYLNSIFDTEIPEDEDVLAGFLLKEFEHFPNVGDIIERNNLTFKVLETENRTITKVQIVK